MIRLTAFLVLFPTMLLASSPAELSSNGEIPRFIQVSDGVFRGGQPTEKGFQLLKQRGIKTVINLRMENDESAIVQKLGMNYVQIPVEDIRPWTQIPEGAISKYFELLNNPANYPIFFHCRRGADRTGAMAALYRVAVQGWTAKKAYSEARDVGMRWFYQGLKTQLYDFKPPSRAELQPTIEAK